MYVKRLYSIAWALPVLALTSAVEVFNKYLFSDVEFIAVMVILIACDTLLGILYAIKTKSFRSRKLGGLINKVATIGVALTVVHALAVFMQGGGIMVEWIRELDKIVYSFIIFREIVSINEKSHVLGFPILPYAFFKKLKDFVTTEKPKEEDPQPPSY